MEISFEKIALSEIVKDFVEDEEKGVVGFGGKLNIRPPYQREFVYDDKKQAAVIESIMSGRPISIFYWMENEDGTYELLDGQQRTLSICHYFNKLFPITLDRKPFFYQNLTPDKQATFNNYQIHVYKCKGTHSEKIDWFKTINIAGKPLNEQEILNAVYNGPWINDAKKYFSKRDCNALKDDRKKYITGSAIEQQILAKVLKWFAGYETTEKNKFDVEKIMGKYQQEASANKLINYYEQVMSWVKANFPFDCVDIEKVDWGFIYNVHKDIIFSDTKAVEKRVKELILDDEVTRNTGIFEYIFDRDKTHLSLRKFPDDLKKKKYYEQDCKCAACGEKFDINAMHGDHISPWSKGGRTTYENLQMLCAKCNIIKKDHDLAEEKDYDRF